MYYLKVLLKSFLYFKGKGLLLLLTFALIPSALFFFEYQGEYSKKELETSYFDALIFSKVGHQNKITKIKNLPGVNSLYFYSEKELAAKVQEIKKNLNVSIPTSFSEITFIGFRVYLKKELRPESRELVREYTRKIFKNNISISGIIKLENKEENLAWDKVKIPVIALLLFIWVTLFFIFSKDFHEFSKVIESFQRRKLTTFISLFILNCFFICLPLVIFSLLYLSQLEVVFLISGILLVLPFLYFERRGAS